MRFEGDLLQWRTGSGVMPGPGFLVGCEVQGREGVFLTLNVKVNLVVEDVVVDGAHYAVCDSGKGQKCVRSRW